MRITSWNVNGLRAALRKGFADHIEAISPDVLMLQEVRAFPEQLPEAWQAPEGWHVLWNPAEKKGYAGTAIWSREPITLIDTGLNKTDKDPEGRLVLAQAFGVTLGCVYLPSGSSGEHRQIEKEKWMKRFGPWAKKLRAIDGPAIFGGDLNIAHTERDIFYAKGNAKNSGFLPHERDWLSKLMGTGWSDVVREDYDRMLDAGEDVSARFGAGGEGLDLEKHGPYSWWSNRGGARHNNRGWRIDYLLANETAAQKITATHIHREAGLACSDHTPVSVDMDL